jgi:lysophospholipase L1-like esterase
MKTTLLSLFIAVTLCSFLPQSKKMNIWMMGDSTMSIKAKDKYPETGWGVPFAKLFKSHVTIHNRAKNGRSTKSFIHEGLWADIYQELQEGDYVFIQFGHNDEKVDKPKTGPSIDEYKSNLSLFVEKVRAKKATPILLSPIARRSFVEGKLVDTHGEYPNAAQQVADSLNVAFIDMTTKTFQLLQEKGEQKSIALFLHLPPNSTNYPNGVVDNTHLNNHGATVIAKMVAKALKNQKIPLASELK